MKNILIASRYFVTGLLLLTVSCKNYADNKSEAATSVTDSLINNSSQAADSAYQTGARLVAANDCLTCHKIDQKNIGPAYVDIARKYEMNQGNIENLAHKIIAGGYGRWGTTPMTPHANVSQSDAEEMTKYVLSLRKD